MRTVFTSGATVYAGTGAGLFKSVGGGGWQPVAQGAEEDPKNPKKLNASVQAVLTGTRRHDARGRRQRRRLQVHRRRRDLEAAGPRQRHGALRDGLEPRPSSVPGIVFAATQSGVYRSTDFGSTWTLRNDGITGTVLRVFKDDEAPNIYYAAGTTASSARSTAASTWSKINTGAERAERDDPRDEAVHRRRPDAPVRRHPGRRLRRHDRPRPVPGPGQVAQGHQQRPRQQHDRLGAVELPHDARHAARRHAVQRRLRADLHAADQHRRCRRSPATRPGRQDADRQRGHVDRHADDRVRVPVVPLPAGLRQGHRRDREDVRRSRPARSARAGRSRSTGTNDFPTLRPQRRRERP